MQSVPRGIPDGREAYAERRLGLYLSLRSDHLSHNTVPVLDTAAQTKPHQQQQQVECSDSHHLLCTLFLSVGQFYQIQEA